MSLRQKKAKSSKAKSSSTRSKPKERDPLGDLSGRPTEYDPKYCGKLIQFSREAAGHFTAFAASIGVHRDTLYSWAKKYPEFADAKKVAREINEQAMFKVGLNGMKGFNGQGSWQSAWIFAMKARYGWREEGPRDQEDDTDFEFDHEGEKE